MAEKSKAVLQAHGLNQDELEALQVKQAQGEAGEKIKGNKSSDYELNATDAHLVHALLKTPNFDPITGVDRGQEVVQTFYPNEFMKMEKEQAFAGQKVTILHDPSAEAQDQGSHDHLKAQVMSEPGAGTPLTGVAGGLADLKKQYAELFPGAKVPTKKADLEQAIAMRIPWGNDPVKQEELKTQEELRLQAAGANNPELTQDGTQTVVAE